MARASHGPILLLNLLAFVAKLVFFNLFLETKNGIRESNEEQVGDTRLTWKSSGNAGSRPHRPAPRFQTLREELYALQSQRLTFFQKNRLEFKNNYINRNHDWVTTQL